MLIGATQGVKNMNILDKVNIDYISSIVIDLATKIYNGEPTSPFDEPKEDKF